MKYIDLNKLIVLSYLKQSSYCSKSSVIYIVCLFQGPHVPQDYLYQTLPNEKIGTLVTNSRLSDRLLEKNLPKVSNLDVSIDNGRYNAKVRLYLPHDFDENKKYPLLVNVYAGPNSQQVNDRYSA